MTLPALISAAHSLGPPFSQLTPPVHKTGLSGSCTGPGRGRQTGSENPERPGAQVGQGRSSSTGGWSEEAIPLFVLPGSLEEAGPFSVPPGDVGELLASPAAAEQRGWPMDLPESQAGGPAAEGKWLYPCLSRGRMKREEWVDGTPGCDSGTWERWPGVAEPPPQGRVGGREGSLMKCLLCAHLPGHLISFALGRPDWESRSLCMRCAPCLEHPLQ